ncbi:hypothetical protein Droror1_Dr00012121 [Drosera rotundifolia]
MIDYFQGIEGVAPISPGYNPATWMLEITTPAVEERIGEDFVDIYRNSNQYREVEAVQFFQQCRETTFGCSVAPLRLKWRRAWRCSLKVEAASCLAMMIQIS